MTRQAILFISPIFLIGFIQCLYIQDPVLTRYPVILVPGYGGNQLYAKLNKTRSIHYFCDLKTSDYFEIWLNLVELSPFVIDCLVENLQLRYKNETQQTYNNDGVDIKIKDFGLSDTVEYFDSSKVALSAYFNVIVDALVKKANYVRNVNVRGAPYDWRKSPDELHLFYENLTKLVEETYYLNNQTRIMLIAHSMGNPVTVYWINNYVDKAWKAKFIKYFVSLSPPWGGAIKVLRLMSSGDNLDSLILRPLSLRPFQRSAASSAFLLPNNKYWNEDEVLVSRPGKNYTVKDYEEFFRDLNYPQGYALFKKTSHLLGNLKPPEVEMHSLFGVGLKTPESLVFKKESHWPDTQPSVIYSDGDGTVNKRSLNGYKKWIGKQKEPIYHKEIPGAEHLETLRHPNVIQYIFNLMYL